MKKRRSVKSAAVLLVAALVCLFSVFALAACGDTDGGKTFETVPVLQDTRGTEAETATFTTLNGDSVTYNKNTRRIVALSGAGDLAAFGIRPLAVMADQATMSAYPGFFDGVDTLSYTQPFNVEEIATYEPELILVYQLMDDSQISRLEAIAPVIPLYRESFDFRQRLGYIGDIFGLEENAETLINYAEGIQAEAVDRIEAMGLEGKTVSVFYYAEGISIPPGDSWYFNKIIYDYLGMKRTAAAEEFLANSQNNPFTPISNESVRNFEGDVVIYVDLYSINGQPSMSEALMANPGWQSLKAYQEDRIGLLDAMLYAEKDVLYLAAQYNGLIEAFEKAV